MPNTKGHRTSINRQLALHTNLFRRCDLNRIEIQFCGLCTVGARRWCPPKVATSEVKQPAPQRNGHRVRSIVCTQLVDDVLDVEVDCGFRYRQSIGNLLVAIAVVN